MFRINTPSVGRAVAVLGTSVLCAVLVAAPPAAAETNKVLTGNECSDYTVIGVGGSKGHDLEKNDPNGNINDSNGKPIPRVTSLKKSMFSYAAENIRSAVPDDKSVKFIQVEYSPVDEYSGLAGSMSATPDEYVTAINSGLGKFAEAVDRASQCGDTQIVAFGFGQGAGVIRVSLEKLSQNSLSNVRAVWFMGDAIHDGSGKDGFEYYDAGSKWDQSYNGWTRVMDYNQKLKKQGKKGDAKFNQQDIPAPIPHEIPAALKGKVLSMCHAADIACSPVKNANSLSSSAENYLKGDFLSYGAKWVMNKLDSAASVGSSNGSAQASSDVVWDKGVGAKWVAEDKSDPYKFGDRCISDYAIIAARGSGEESNGGTGPNGEVGGQPSIKSAPRIPGFSDILATAAWGIRERLPSNSTVQFIPVKYPAHSIPFMNGPGVRNLGGPLLVGPYIPSGILETSFDAGEFLQSAVDGGESSQATIERLIDTCPNTKVLVMGYSQGAWAVHMALDKMDSKYLKKISGAYLIADPLRNASDDGAEYFDMYVPDGSGAMKRYTKPEGMGITAVLEPLSRKSLSDDMKYKVLQVCNHNDGVCNFISNPEKSRPQGYFDSALGTHPTYLEQLIFGSTVNQMQEIAGLSEVHPHIYKEQPQFWTYPAIWGANKLLT